MANTRQLNPAVAEFTGNSRVFLDHTDAGAKLIIDKTQRGQLASALRFVTLDDAQAAELQ
jgi:hypothetical protein